MGHSYQKVVVRGVVVVVVGSVVVGGIVTVKGGLVVVSMLSAQFGMMAVVAEELTVAVAVGGMVVSVPFGSVPGEVVVKGGTESQTPVTSDCRASEAGRKKDRDDSDIS